jgi:hypothetical protein
MKDADHWSITGWVEIVPQPYTGAFYYKQKEESSESYAMRVA